MDYGAYVMGLLTGLILSIILLLIVFITLLK